MSTLHAAARARLTSAVAVLLALPVLGAAAPADARAQDTLNLASLHDAALRHDPRTRQLVLQDSATTLRLRSLAAERLPALRIGALASYQSEVAALPIRIPGTDVPQPPKDRYEATLDAEQLVYDGGVIARRRAAEEARLQGERARIAVALQPLRTEVNQAYFRAALLQSRGAEVAILIEDLEARLDLVRAQVRAGTALPSDTAEVLAEVLRAQQGASEVRAQRRTALAVLAELTGVALTPDAVLAVPDLAPQVREVVEALRTPPDAGSPSLRTHPRFALFDAEREQLARQRSLVDARLRPQVAAFAQLGYGRPGPRQFTDDFHEYWSAGVRLRWQPWTWGTSRREREGLRLQGEMLATEEAAFARQLRRQVLGDAETIAQLEEALDLDARIIALREQVERRARAQLAERAITASGYVDARADLQEARLARERHRTELALARAQLLTTLGHELR